MKPVPIFEYDNGRSISVLCYFPDSKCWSCNAKPTFDGWGKGYVPEQSDARGRCLKHLMEIGVTGMNYFWGPDWVSAIQKFLRENPELCLEI